MIMKRIFLFILLFIFVSVVYAIKVSFYTRNGDKYFRITIDTNNKTITQTNMDTNSSKFARLIGLYTMAKDIQGKVKPGDLIFRDNDTIKWFMINKREQYLHPRIVFSKDHWVQEWFDFYPNDEEEFNETFNRLYSHLEETGQIYEKIEGHSTNHPTSSVNQGKSRDRNGTSSGSSRLSTSNRLQNNGSGSESKQSVRQVEFHELNYMMLDERGISTPSDFNIINQVELTVNNAKGKKIWVEFRYYNADNMNAFSAVSSQYKTISSGAGLVKSFVADSDSFYNNPWGKLPLSALGLGNGRWNILVLPYIHVGTYNSNASSTVIGPGKVLHFSKNGENVSEMTVTDYR